jgi:hypothetical protein
MRAFAEWVSSRPHRSILVAALLGILSPLLELFAPLLIPSAAIVVLNGLRHGLREALFVLGSAALLVVIARVLMGTGAAVALALMVGLWLPAAGMAELLRRSRSLSLCLQAAVLGVGALALLFFATGDPVARMQEVLATMRGELERALQTQMTADTMLNLARAFTAAAFGGTVITLTSSLLLGRWWETLVGAPGTFAAEFRQLRMGMVLAAAFALIVVAQLVTKAVVLNALVCVLGVGFVFQGLAVLHAVAAAQGLSAGWIVALYVALFATAFYAAVIIGLVGWLDSWVDLRRRLQGTQKGR